MGPGLAEFEQAIAAYLGSPFAVAVNSGTSALHLALRCLDLHEGDEVIVPSFAFAAIANVLLQERIAPVFVDIDQRTLNPTPAAIQAAIGPRTRAVLVVHTFGYPAEIDVIREITRGHKLRLIEDACEALGAEVRGKKVGSFGDAALFAFYPNKQITTGEGGILVTADPAIAHRAKLLRSQGKDDSLDWAGQHTEIGYSYRISDINCALGTAQLSRLDGRLEQRQKLAASYEARLRHHPAIRPPLSACPFGRISWFAYAVQLAENSTRQDRDRVLAIATRPRHRRGTLLRSPAQPTPTPGPPSPKRLPRRHRIRSLSRPGVALLRWLNRRPNRRGLLHLPGPSDTDVTTIA